MDGPRNCHTDWSKSERERQISYDIARYCLRGESMYFISKSKFAPYESQGTLVEKKKKKERESSMSAARGGPWKPEAMCAIPGFPTGLLHGFGKTTQGMGSRACPYYSNGLSWHESGHCKLANYFKRTGKQKQMWVLTYTLGGSWGRQAHRRGNTCFDWRQQTIQQLK